MVVAVVAGGNNGGTGAAPQIIPPHSHLFNHQRKSPCCCDSPHQRKYGSVRLLVTHSRRVVGKDETERGIVSSPFFYYTVGRNGIVVVFEGLGGSGWLGGVGPMRGGEAQGFLQAITKPSHTWLETSKAYG